MKIFIGLLLLSCLFGCTDPDGARRALHRDGYTEIEITGYDWFGCARSDGFSTGFRAWKNGERVNGVFCSSWIKGGTIRTY